MSNSDTSGFGKFVPGFDFLQNLAKGAGGGISQMPGLGNWVAPTLNVEELDKRIEELKNVHFWLEQNSRALAATIQALEVQKMTLATLKGMNFNIGDVANAFKLKTADRAGQTVAPEPQPEPKSEPQAAAVPKPAASGPAAKKAAAAKGATPLGVVDPLQLWGSLAQQFQNIAAGAIKDVASTESVKTEGKKTPAKRPSARRAPAKKSGRG